MLTVLIFSVAFVGFCLMLFIFDMLVPCYIDPKVLKGQLESGDVCRRTRVSPKGNPCI